MDTRSYWVVYDYANGQQEYLQLSRECHTLEDATAYLRADSECAISVWDDKPTRDGAQLIARGN